MKYVMKKNVMVLLLLIYPVICFAQDDIKLGLYLRGKAGEISMIPPSAFADGKNNLDLIGWEKPSISLSLRSTESKTVTDNQRPEFFFFFIDETKDRMLNAKEVGMMIRNYPFIYGITPNDFILVRLFRTNKNRALRLEKEKVLSGSRYRAFNVDTIPFTAIPMQNNAFKVIVDSDIPYGEYGFLYKGDVPYERIIYDFCINRK
jgi:hypothetical protein